MEPAHRALLRAHRRYLSDELLVCDSIVPLLYQEEVLTQEQVEVILGQTSSRSRTLKLLDLLPSRGPRAFHVFIRSLDDFSWVRDLLLQELQRPGGPGGPAPPGATDSWLLPGPGPGPGPGSSPGSASAPGAGSGLAPGPGLGSGPGSGPGPGPGSGLATSPGLAPGPGLGGVPSDRQLSRVAGRLGEEWEEVLMDLGLSEAELFRCRADHGLSTRSAALAGLVLWRRRGGRGATTGRLLQSLETAGRGDALTPPPQP